MVYNNLISIILVKYSNCLQFVMKMMTVATKIASNNKSDANIIIITTTIDVYHSIWHTWEPRTMTDAQYKVYTHIYIYTKQHTTCQPMVDLLMST